MKTLEKVWEYRPFPRCLLPLFQNESWYTTFHMEMSLLCKTMKTHFHMKRCAPGLVLKTRIKATQKWPIRKSWFIKTLACDSDSHIKLSNILPNFFPVCICLSTHAIRLFSLSDVSNSKMPKSCETSWNMFADYWNWLQIFAYLKINIVCCRVWQGKLARKMLLLCS